MASLIEEKAYLDLGGTVRSQSVEITLHKLRAIFPKLGITRVANITGLDNIGVPVAICIRANSKHLSVSQGKGLTWELAQASAIMESIEAYHAENTLPPNAQGSYVDLKNSYPVVDPRFFNSGDFTIPEIERWNFGWTEAIDINQKGNQVMIPHVLTSLDSTQCHPEYSFLSVSTNGLAAGNTQEEAICHGLCEVIERDSLYRWATLSDIKRKNTQLALDSIDSKINEHVIKKLYAADQLVKVWDITSLLGIPSFHCVIKDSNPLRNLGMFRGTGTHLLKEIALSRALTEAAQSRAAVISGTRDDIFSDQYQQKRTFSYSKEEYQGQKMYQTCMQPSIELNFSANIAYVCQRLTQEGFPHVFIINQTKKELDIPVVHVFIPGMKFNGARI